MIGNAQTTIPPQQLWRQKFPAVISGLFSFVQLIITVVIIGCEVGSMLIDIVTGTIYVGIWASFFFMIAWISQAASSCCCRGRGCASYTLVVQCISMFFAACVIGFDTYYLISPTTCFFPSTICTSSVPTRGLFYTVSNFYNIKIPLIKGQLAAGAVMFVLCLVYIIIYIITTIRVQRAKRPQSIHPEVPNSVSMPPTISNGIFTAPPISSYPVPGSNYAQPMTNYQPPAVLNNASGQGTELVCPTCSTVMRMTAAKRPPM